MTSTRILDDGERDDPRALVVVFLRGGADGLALVPPVGDDAYHRARPRLAVSAKDAVALDGASKGFFAWNPALRELAPLFAEGELSIVHAAGSDDDTRSHFEAQDRMEHGGGSVAGGWIGRWLRSRDATSARAASSAVSALSAFSIGTQIAESLRGAPSATTLEDLDELAPSDGSARERDLLAELYRDDALLGASARDAIAASERIGALASALYVPEHGAVYATSADGEPARRFGARLALVARLVKARLGVRAATIDLDGWDSHFVQDTVIEPRMRALSLGLAAFARDLGPALATTSVVVMSEFGRRVGENGSLGTDHGRGGAMLVLGGGTPAGVAGEWPGLEEGSLVGPGDLSVANDWRDVLASVLARHGRLDAERTFPGHAPRALRV